jgi:hypothetical protein
MDKDKALKLALEALETELAVDMINGAEVGEAAELMFEAITAIKQALAAQPAPVQEPVAWAVVGEGEWGEWVIGQQFETNNPPNHEYWKNRGYLLVPLYTTPPAAQRQWVGLTDKQMVDAIEPLYQNRATAEMAAKVSMDEFRTIEAKLKEKNT